MTYSKGDYVLGAGKLEGSKRPCLYIGNKYCIHKVASFSSDKSFEEFIIWMEFFMGLRRSPIEGDR